MVHEGRMEGHLGPTTERQRKVLEVFLAVYINYLVCILPPCVGVPTAPHTGPAMRHIKRPEQEVGSLTYAGRALRLVLYAKTGLEATV